MNNGKIKPKPVTMMSVKCPICNKRAFDIKKTKDDALEISLKCPHCHKIVTVPVTSIAT